MHRRHGRATEAGSSSPYRRGSWTAQPGEEDEQLEDRCAQCKAGEVVSAGACTRVDDQSQRIVILEQKEHQPPLTGISRSPALLPTGTLPTQVTAGKLLVSATRSPA